MQEGRNSPAYNGGNFSPVMDNPTHQFHKWIANNLTELKEVNVTKRCRK